MSRLQVIAGNFGTGPADWTISEFVLPGRQRLSVEQIATVQENGEYLQKTFASFLKGGTSGAIGLGVTAAVVGIFAAPLAAVGAIGLTAAAIGAGLGALGGAERKVLVQVTARDGLGFVAICERELPAEILKAISVVRAVEQRSRVAEAGTPLSGLFPGALGRQQRPAIPAPTPALPAPVPTPVVQPEVVDMKPDAAGIFHVAGNALSATAESASTLAVDAYAATTEAVGNAWSAVVTRLPKGPKQA